jgi:glycosyltransferase involved in cell wall biosynthesis
VGSVQDRRALARIFQQADLLVMPSLYESFGLPMLEAMACGTPVLASKLPALREIGGDAPLYFDPHDSEGLAERIRTVLTQGTLASDMRQRGLTRAAQFTWHRCAQHILEVMADV